MAGSSRKFPQYLSRPFQVLWFEVDELAIFTFTLTVALIYGGLAWIVFVAIQYGYIRTKRSKPRGLPQAPALCLRLAADEKLSRLL